MTVVLALERYLAITKPIEYHNAIQGHSEDGILMRQLLTATRSMIYKGQAVRDNIKIVGHFTPFVGMSVCAKSKTI